VISERLDNVIHASANSADAEREIKLWFEPCDIPPLMRVYPTEVCEENYYLGDGGLRGTYEPGSVCLLAPGDVVWRSDLEVLRSHSKDVPAAPNLNTVAAKYLINRDSQGS
jgi:hypothetical protein